MENAHKPLSKIAGENLKCLIKETKYRTQEEFAYAFGTETRTLSRRLNQGVKDIDTLEQLADFLSADIIDLLRHQ
ncbi:MAG TPA: hypothetical protein IAD51_01795 [Candidatus Limadaptatus stercorigallinarum]|uniref:Uncharacterized protein n=1 Tax=Candidatus Limadaptatus stercorigallinarum TaxID=2840845 RepID=A0A9D1HSL1_9FIRM|nr:hypothetical protein [Candidatus Limadaptatus stercorigallinarum]